MRYSIERLAKRPTVLFFIAALLLRVGWVLVGGKSALAWSDDARAYNDIATNVVQHHTFVTVLDPPHRFDVPYAARPPLTPLALAAVFGIFGTHLVAAQLLLAVLGSLAVAVLYLLARRLFSNRIALTTGLLASAYPFFVFLPAVPLTENIALLLTALLGLMLTDNPSIGTTRNAALLGVVIGLAVLNRPQTLGFIPFLAPIGYLATRDLWRSLRWVLLAATVSVATIAPWAIRNRIVVGGWFPVTLQGGTALYMGNNPYTQAPLDSLWKGGRGWYDDPRMSAELHGSSSLDTDRRALRLAVDFIKLNPGRVVVYSVQKVGIFFTAFPNLLSKLSWYPILGLSVFGFISTRRDWRRLLPLYLLIIQTLLTAAIFTSMPRFRAPVEPLFLLMASCAIWIRSRSADDSSTSHWSSL